MSTTSFSPRRQRRQEGKEGKVDVWEDSQLMYYLKEQKYQEETSNSERNRVKKRAAFYMLAVDGKLLRKLPDGSSREVPKKESRAEIIQQLSWDGALWGQENSCPGPDGLLVAWSLG
jgi:hypothetical protein